ncbi:MAG: AAA family ATPase [Candidatus Schekmanbacteria bacterium]|nr:AAA family ATPase [Candidatus Schekmanbacteria bacterium]
MAAVMGAQAATHSSAMPEEIGPYRVQALLGQGACGSVYEAVSPMGTVVAVKAVRVPAAETLRSIRREILALTRLDHPGVVRVVDENAAADPPWFAMERVSGRPLLEALAIELDGLSLEQRLPCVLSAFQRLCLTLAYLHGTGLVHRDLKSANILLAPGAAPIIVDFGISAAFPASGEGERLAVESGFFGNLEACAPEQLRGEMVDARADLYALGCLLFHAVSGRPVFPGTTAAELVRAHLLLEPPELRTVAPEVPVKLGLLLRDLLRKDVRERLGYADIVAARLQALGAGAGTWSGAPRHRAYLYRARFQGREQELRRFQIMLDGAIAGQPGILMIEGESGSGKTRLMIELGRSAAQARALVLTGEASRDRRRPLQPWIRPLTAIADLLRLMPEARAAEIVGPWSHLLAEYAAEFAALAPADAPKPPASLPPNVAIQRLFRAIRELLANLSAHQPVLVLLDDVQWSDSLGMKLLAHLATTAALAGTRVLVVAAYRPLMDQSALCAVRDSPLVSYLALGQLAESAIVSMLQEMLALSRVPAALAQLVCERAGGNPFFVAEYGNAAVAAGILGRDERGRWQVGSAAPAISGGNLATLPLPEGIGAIVRQHLLRLSPAARTVLFAAAVLGRDFPEDLLDAQMALPGPELSAAVSELIHAKILEDRGGPRLGFAHDRFREVAQAEMTGEEKARLHRAAALALEARLAGTRDDRAKIRAHADLGRHWLEAGESSKAQAHLLPAARAAATAYAFDIAEEAYRNYARLLQGDARALAELHAEIATRVYRAQGNLWRAVAELGAAQEAWREAGDPVMSLKAGIDRLNALSVTGQVEVARAEAEKLLAAAAEVADPALRARALSSYGSLLITMNRPHEAIGVLQEGLAASEAAGDHLGAAVVLVRLGRVYADLRQVQAGQDVLKTAIVRLRELGDRYWEIIATINLAGMCHLAGELVDAEAHYRQALASSEACGNARLAQLSALWLGSCLSDTGRVRAAEELLRGAADKLEVLGDLQNAGQARLALGVLLRRTGAAEAGTLEQLEAAESLFREVEELPELARSIACRGHLALAAERSAESMIQSARAILSRYSLPDESGPMQAVRALEAAQEVWLAGRGETLLAGEVRGDVPAGVQQWRAEQEAAQRRQLGQRGPVVGRRPRPGTGREGS